MEFQPIPFWQILIIASAFQLAQLGYGNMENEYANEEDYHSSENESDSVLIFEHVGNQGGSILIPQNKTRSARRATVALKTSATSSKGQQTEKHYKSTPQSSNSAEADTYSSKEEQQGDYQRRLAELYAKQLQTRRFRKITAFPKFPKYPKESFSAEKPDTQAKVNSKSDSEKTDAKRESPVEDYPDTAILGEDGNAGNYETPFNPSEYGKPHKSKKPCNKTGDMPPESEENPDLITGAEPVDGPRGKPQHGATELLRRSYQPYFTCGRNTDAGIQGCRILCDIRDRQHITCLEDFCYCQTSYTFHNPANFEPSDTAPFFLCGRYTLEGYEKCVEECKKKPLATVECGGPACYCHYASSPLKLDLKANQVSGENEDESRSVMEKPPNRIRASYCGRAPSEPMAKPGQTVLSHPDVNDKVNNCKYRCRGGMYSCNKRFCYCSSSGMTTGP